MGDYGSRRAGIYQRAKATFLIDMDSHLGTLKKNSKKALAIIKKIPYINIATVSQDGMPWNAPVFAAYDKDFNFYWGTYRDSQKSKNIRANNNVFITIYDSTVGPGQGEGVYIKATSVELEDPKEIELAHRLLQDRHVVPYWKLEQVTGGPIRLYKAVPEKVWMNDGDEVGGNYIDTRVEVDLLE